ncbi:MAG: hypothetical protein AB1656_00125 [Candidatus Omnitrophota bacterium]
MILLPFFLIFTSAALAQPIVLSEDENTEFLNITYIDKEAGTIGESVKTNLKVALLFWQCAIDKEGKSFVTKTKWIRDFEHDAQVIDIPSDYDTIYKPVFSPDGKTVIYQGGNDNIAYYYPEFRSIFVH